VAKDLLKSEVIFSDRCCSEAGTLASARPDIANQLRFRKEEELKKGIVQLPGADKKIQKEERAEMKLRGMKPDHIRKVYRKYHGLPV